ncbi:Putative ribonuclease H protein At1g65750 [Linum perenne]
MQIRVPGCKVLGYPHIKSKLKNNRSCQGLNGKSFPQYEQLHAVFGTSHATGQGVVAANEDVPPLSERDSATMWTPTIWMTRGWSGIRNVEVQIDSTCVIKILSKEGSLNHQHVVAVGRIKSILQRDWTVNFMHIYREENCLADHLPNKGHDLNLDVHTIDTAKKMVLYWARYDLFGDFEARSVIMN